MRIRDGLKAIIKDLRRCAKENSSDYKAEAVMYEQLRMIKILKKLLKETYFEI